MRRSSALLLVALVVGGCAGGRGGPKEAGKIHPPPAAPATTTSTATTSSAAGVISSTTSSAPPTTVTTRRPVTSPPRVTVPTGSSTSTTNAATTAPPGPTLADVRIRLTPLATLDQPLELAQRAGDDTFYVAEKRGRVRAVRGGAVEVDPVLDLSSEVSTDGERGLLGITFSPDGNLLYAAFTDRAGDANLWEYAFRDGKAATATKREVLYVEHPNFSNHNGGHIAFGPDGMLYYGLGDGGSANDPNNNAQNLKALLGKVLRIDPSKPSGSLPYTIPPDNPFVGRADARGEIWEYGLRNPWRWSFDRAGGDFWIGDVGQNTTEEIDFLPRAAARGANLGWSAYEGSQRTPGKVGATEPDNPVAPVYEYPTRSGCAVTGGYVYRGARIASLQGVYVFADFCNGSVQGLRMDGTRLVEHRALGPVAEQLASFGEDRDGELYVISLAGTLYRIDPA
jgi:glucose/arabinose dehydrogenase